MSYLNDKPVDLIVVPVTCDSEQGTAFFINPRQLLTARHVVKAHFKNSGIAPIYIVVEGHSILCRAQELNLPNRNIDLALLTIHDDSNFESKKFLGLLCDEFVKGLSLKVYGYPQEIGLGSNLVNFQVKNLLQIDEPAFFDRVLKWEDEKFLHDFSGLSGSPIVSISGRAVGIITQQLNANLNYVSFDFAKDHLQKINIPFSEDASFDDMTVTGTGWSFTHTTNVIKTIHGRYTPELHQANEKLDRILDFFTDTHHLNACISHADQIISKICGLSEELQKIIIKRFKLRKGLTPELLKRDKYSLFISIYNFIQKEDPFKNHPIVTNVQNLNEIVYALRNENLYRLNFINNSNLCLIGKAGTGKTHNLCEYSKKNQGKANIFLFFGTNFKSSESPISYIQHVAFRDMSFEDFNIELENRGRYAIIVIDALNEGRGISFWNENLAPLRTVIDKCDRIKLIISVRHPFDTDLIDLAGHGNWEIQTIEGFENKEDAIEKYFTYYKIEKIHFKHNLESFKNPLFLKIFCETFATLTQDELKTLSKQMLYTKYVARKNNEVSEFIDEDTELNIAEKYLSKLARYCVFYNHFNSIPKEKAREYSKHLAPYRTWSKDLLNACLSTNLLLYDRMGDGRSAVMFEYENLGDYYMANVLLNSKMGISQIMSWIENELKYIDQKKIPSEKFKSSIKAFFDCCYHHEIDICNEKQIHMEGTLYDLFYESMIESDIPYDELISILLKLDDDKANPLLLLERYSEMSLDETLQIHKKLKSFHTVAARDLIWSKYVNDLFEFNGPDFIGAIPVEKDPVAEVDDEERKFLICLTWMLSSSHPALRAILIRKIKKILSIHPELIKWLAQHFESVNDPYIVGGLYCAVCGVIITSRNIKLVNSIAELVYNSFYQNEDNIPQDLWVRQWTFKIIEYSSYLNNFIKSSIGNSSVDDFTDYWQKIKTPFKPKFIGRIDIPTTEYPKSDYFGIQNGSLLMYNSIFNFEDFNRYIIGTNNRNVSDDFFELTPQYNGLHKGVSLNKIMAEMAFYIKNVLGWSDKLGSLDNGKYSRDRSRNIQERIGKKFQWLAWSWINAHLMDTSLVSRSPYFWSSEARKEDLTPTPYPWNSSEVSRFDPTLDEGFNHSDLFKLSVIGNQIIVDSEDHSWINDKSILPEFRYLAKNNNEDDFVLLIGWDTFEKDNKGSFLYSSACFVKKTDSEKFAKWTIDKNFYGRWMPEYRGSTDFLWNEYPWSDAYRNSIEENPWQKPSDCPNEILLAYMAQLQEDWEGIDDKYEHLSTVYIPCEEMMKVMKLYCSEKRGIIKDPGGNVAGINIEVLKGMHGLFVRRDILNKFLIKQNYEMFYYVTGEKTLKQTEYKKIFQDISAAYKYQPSAPIDTIQPMRIIERDLPTSHTQSAERAEKLLKKFNDEGALTQREVIELLSYEKAQNLLVDPDLDELDELDSKEFGKVD